MPEPLKINQVLDKIIYCAWERASGSLLPQAQISSPLRPTRLIVTFPFWHPSQWLASKRAAFAEVGSEELAWEDDQRRGTVS